MMTDDARKRIEALVLFSDLGSGINIVETQKLLDNSKELSFVKLNGEKKKVSDFVFLNQDNLFIGNEDFLGKVFIAEFFFLTTTILNSKLPINSAQLER